MNAAAQQTGHAASTKVQSLFTVTSFESGGTRPDLLSLLAQPVDTQPHRIARAQIDRRSLSETDSGRSAGGNDVARMQAHHSGQIADQLRNAEDHVGAVAVLIALAIHFEPHGKSMGIGDLILRDEPGSERTEGVATLALVPGAAALELEFPLGYVMDDAVTCYMGQRFRLRNVAPMSTNHDAEFHFPIGFLRAARNFDVIVRANDGAGPLSEDHGLRGNRQIGLGRVVGKVETDTDELPHLAHARAEPHTRGHLR